MKPTLTDQEIVNINCQLARLVAILEVRQRDYKRGKFMSELSKQFLEADLEEANQVKASFFNKMVLQKD